MTARRLLWIPAVAIATLLSLSPLLDSKLLTAPLGHVPLLAATPTMQSIGVYALVLLSAVAGIATQTRPAVTALFVCALVAVFADARFAIALAAVAAPVLVKASTA